MKQAPVASGHHYRDGRAVDDTESVLGPEVIAFVETHVDSLLTWDILLFFQRNPDGVFDIDALSSRLGRAPGELAPEVESRCARGILETAGGLIRYGYQEHHHRAIDAFADACRDRGQRLALIALVLQKLNPNLRT